MRFICVDDEVPEITVDLLRAAREPRGIEFIHIDAARFGVDLSVGLAVGDMLYCPAVSSRAARVEQFLTHDGVASFYTSPFGAFSQLANYPMYFQQLGLPVPRVVPLATTDREGLKAAVAQVSGLPAIV